MIDLERLRAVLADGTPAPWKYDLGNWEVEGPRPDRYPICLMDPASRVAAFEGQAANPVSSLADGALICELRNLADTLISELEAARSFIALTSHECVCHVKSCDGYMGISHSDHCDKYLAARAAYLQTTK